jgi:tetratricopeptide (TPR) repeat protein
LSAQGTTRRLGAPALAVLLLAAIRCGPASPPPAPAGGETSGEQASLPSAPAAPPGAAPAPAPAPRVERPARPVPPELLAAVERSPADVAARRELAIALFEANRKSEALPHFEKLVRLDPSARHLLDLALCYGALSRTDEAESTYHRILEREPRHAIAMHNLGNLALQRGETQQSIEWYRRAIEVDPRYLLATLHLGQALKRAGNYRQAYETLENVLRIDLEHPTPADVVAYDDALYELALLDVEMGAYERAAGFLETLIEANPDYPNAHYSYGRVLTMLGRTKEAQRAFQTHQEQQARPAGGPAASGAAETDGPR